MESRENSVFGRKVFFINPSIRIQNQIIAPLKKDEYEIYTISDYRDGKPILSQNEDAICYINIDEQLSYKQWFNYIHSFKNDSTLNKIIIGAISKNSKPQDREQYILKLNLPAGFINLNDSSVMAHGQVEKILELNGAKGRRKYVRLDCYGIENVKASCVISNRLVTLVLDDLSSVGFAARCPSNFAKFFQKGGVYGLTLHLGPKDYVVTGIIYAIKENEADTTFVFMLAPKTSYEIKDEMRSFIFKELQKKMDSLLDSQIKDDTDYSKEVTVQNDAATTPESESFQEIADVEPENPQQA